MAEEDTELKNIVEAALLAAEAPLSIAGLTALFPEGAAPSTNRFRDVFEQLERDYDGRGVELKKVGKGYRFQSREKYSPWLRKLSENRPPRYSRAFLETLAIVAYRQPVTRGDVEEIRGVSVSSEIMRGLLDRGWIKHVGQRDVPGRPGLYGTTQEFLEYFNLEALSELPPLLERREATEIANELNLRLPLEEQDQEGTREGEDQSAQRANEGSLEAESESADVNEAQEDRPTAQVISIDDALTSKDSDGEAS